MSQSNFDHPFERTSCACAGCVACCKRQPGPLVTGDFERIAAFIAERDGITLSAAEDALRRQLWASPGSVVKDLSTGATRRIGSITPRFKKGRCVFLNENDRCNIWAVSPFGCAFFDTHMPREMSNERSVWAAQQMDKPAYQALRDTLPMATHYKPNYNT